MWDCWATFFLFIRNLKVNADSRGMNDDSLDSTSYLHISSDSSASCASCGPWLVVGLVRVIRCLGFITLALSQCRGTEGGC